MTPRRHEMSMVTMRRKWGDCGIATLSMLLDLPYAEVSHAARQLFPTCHKEGLGLRDAELVAESLHFKVRRVYRSKGYLDGATGMLGLLFKDSKYAGHWVCIKSGVIVDPAGQGSVSSVPDYLAKYHVRPVTMLVVERD